MVYTVVLHLSPFVFGDVVLPRDATHKRGLCRRAVCVTFVYCVDTAKKRP